MKSLAVVVRASDAERVRRLLADQRLLRGELRVARHGGEVWFPVVAAPVAELPTGRVAEGEFERAAPNAPTSYRERLKLPPEAMDLLPRSFDVVGDIVLIRLPEELDPHASAIGRALLDFVPASRVVGWDHGVHGEQRLRSIERIAGDGPFQTRYRENGLDLDVDLERAYFSPRLGREHARVAASVSSGDTVLDLCCGVGPFALTIAAAGRARSVTAVDANPYAIEALRRSLARLAPSTPVRPVLARLESFLPPSERAERVIVNLPLEGIKYAASVGASVAPGGVLYYYTIAERDALAAKDAELLSALPGPAAWTLVERHLVHPYSPAADLLAYTFRRDAA
ncbi:MAG: methyltransferase domain-containing protein [Thermoplasmata archaeon]|nr:methyltransferase domain-containing protein [Thermoplasmata archaeon]